MAAQPLCIVQRELASTAQQNPPSTFISRDDNLVQPWRKWLNVSHTVEHTPGTAEDCHEARNSPCAALRLKSGGLLFLNTGNGSVN